MRSIFVAVLAGLTTLVPVASAAAADPVSVTYAGGQVAITGTAAADALTLTAGGQAGVVYVRNDANSGFTADPSGVCTATQQLLRCDLGAHGLPTTADVVADLRDGADALTVQPGATGVGTVTATYADALSALAYTGGTPASATVAGVTDTLSGVGRIVGTPFADSLTGAAPAEAIVAGAGDDHVDVTAGGGAADTVDCGDGTDTLLARAGTDTWTGCEVVNGVDTTTGAAPGPTPAPTPAPTPVPLPAPAPPAPTPSAPEITNTRPQLQPGAKIAIDLTCPSGCSAGTPVVPQPPPTPWTRTVGGSRLASATVKQVAVALAGERPTLKDAQGLFQQMEKEQAKTDAGDAGSSSSASDAAQAQAEAIRAMIDAILAVLAKLQQQKVEQLQTKIQRAAGGLRTPFDSLVRAKATRATATAAAARTKPASASVQWLLKRTARALPALRTKLRATGTAGHYRATITAPAWLRGVGRVLRKGHVTTLPVVLQVGATRVRVSLPVPR